MKDDPIIADVRKARDEISERFGGDMAKIYAYFKEEEQKYGGKVKFVRQQKNKTPSKNSSKTLSMIDKSVANLKKGKASKPVDIIDLNKLLD